MTDLRYALRLLRKSRLFTLTVVLTIAIGIGATTAIIRVVNAVLLRPLPFEDSERLMQVAEKNGALRVPAFGASALNYLSWKEATRSIDRLGAIRFGIPRLPRARDPRVTRRPDGRAAPGVTAHSETTDVCQLPTAYCRLVRARPAIAAVDQAH